MSEEYKRFAIIDGEAVTDLTVEPVDWRDYVILNEAPFLPNVGTIGLTSQQEVERARGITITGLYNDINSYLKKIAPDTPVQCPTRPVDMSTLSISNPMQLPLGKRPHPFDRFIPNSPTSHRWKSRR